MSTTYPFCCNRPSCVRRLQAALERDRARRAQEAEQARIRAERERIRAEELRLEAQFDREGEVTAVGIIKYKPRGGVYLRSDSSNAGNTKINWNNPHALLSYGTKPSNWRFSNKSWEVSNNRRPLYLGMEWELSFNYTIETTVKDLVDAYIGRGRYIWKSDSSIMNGQELVLAPMTLQSFHDIDLSKLCRALQAAGARGFDQNCCGIHIHVSNETFNPEKIRNVMAWFMVNRRFIRKFSKRTLDRLKAYCYIPWNLDRWFSDETYAVDHHLAIARTSTTWEFRVFRSTVRYERIKATLHFVDAIIHFALEHSFASCTAPDSLQRFINWLRFQRERKFLYEYIINEPNLLSVPELSQGNKVTLYPKARAPIINLSPLDYQPESNA